jgi:serine/threonine protein kinase
MQTTEPQDAVPEITPLDRLLREWMRRIDAGESPSREEFLAAHPDQHEGLLEFFGNDDFVRQLSGSAASMETSVAAGLRTLSGEPAAAPAPAPPTFPGPFPVAFGQYRLMGMLGQGAMGEVYVAEDARLGRKAAIKVPRREVSEQPGLLDRFLREARASAGLRHHNLCPVYEVNMVDGVPYIAMAFIEGKPLSRMTESNRRHAPRQVAVTIRKIAQALEVAHRAGVVHRDLKPANILIDADGEPIVMDFGLARQPPGEKQARLTQEGMILGTPSYMSPEQVRCEQSRVGPASDVYSLGVIFFELLTGRLPFGGPMISMLMDVANDAKSPPRLLDLRTDIDPELEAICLRMLAKPVEARFATMKDVAAALASYLEESNRPLREAPTSPTFAASANSPPADFVPPFHMAALGTDSHRANAAEAPVSPAPAASRGQSDIPRTPAGWRLRIVGGMAAAVVLLGVIVITIRNRDGSTRKVEVDETAEISITRTPETEAGRGVKPGPAQADPAKNDSPKPSEAASGLPDDPDRRAGAWLQKQRAVFGVDLGLNVHPDDPLPEKPFRILSIHCERDGLEQLGDGLGPALAGPLRGTRVPLLYAPASLTAAGLEKLVVLPEFAGLTGIYISADELEDGMLVPLSKLPELTDINAPRPSPRFTGKGLRNCKGLTDLTLTGFAEVPPVLLDELAALPKLHFLNLSGSSCKPTDAAAIARLPLTHLLLGAASVDDAVAAELANCGTLQWLGLVGNPLTDKGLAELHRLKRLKSLTLEKTNVTPEGVAALRAALPDCVVEYP